MIRGKEKSSNAHFLILICFMPVVGGAAVDLFNPSLPYILTSLHTTQNHVKNLIIIYAFVMGISQLFYGPFSDRKGRRTAIFVAYSCGLVGFLLSALSTSIVMLTLARALTAFAMGGAIVSARSILRDTFTNPSSLKKAFSWVSTTAQLSPAISPSVGGIIQHFAGWRWAFGFMGLYLVGFMILLYFKLPETLPLEKREHNVFRIAHYFELFKNLHFVSFSVASALTYALSLSFYTMSPFIFKKMGFNPIENGFFYIYYAIGLMVGSVSFGKFFYRFTSQAVLVGTASFILLVIIIFLFFISLNVQHMAIFAFCIAVACGISNPLLIVLSLSQFNKRTGYVAAAQGFIRLTSVGCALLVFHIVHLENFRQLVLLMGCLGVIFALVIATTFMKKIPTIGTQAS